MHIDAKPTKADSVLNIYAYLTSYTSALLIAQ